MRAGRLRHRVTLQKLSLYQDTTGAKINRYTNVITVWAEINPFKGKEFFDSHKEIGEITHKIIIRYYEGINRDWRIKFGNRTFNVLSVINTGERNLYIEIICKELLKGENA